MTEQEWLTATDTLPMLNFLKGKASDRKLRLFAVTCARRIVHLLTDARIRRAVEIVELHADGLVGKKSRKKARRDTLHARMEQNSETDTNYLWGERYAADATDGLTLGPFASAIKVPSNAAVAVAYGERNQNSPGCGAFRSLLDQEQAFQSVLVRCIFGNPFRPVTFLPAWRTSTVTSLAQTIYDDRHMPSGLFDNQRMGVLADALEDAGCDNRDILEHCRIGGEHVRGCWVVDLVLGKV